MPRARWAMFKVASSLLLSVVPTYGCSWVPGYFYQVTALKGQVVGSEVARNFALSLPQWFRQSFVRKHAKLSLHEYRWPSSLKDMPLVKVVETDADGRFDFGPVKVGHYTLAIDDGKLFDEFDVEVKEQSKVTASVIIDVTSIKPDCSGGHEFIVKSR